MVQATSVQRQAQCYHLVPERATPGPWSFDVLRSPDSRGMGFICDAHGKEISHHGVSERWESENLANGHLIAAAPDLYHFAVMIRDADEDCKRDGLPTMPAMPRQRLDDAIAKAEAGGTSG